MGKSKTVGNKYLYIGTSKNPKHINDISENIDNNIWKRDKNIINNTRDFNKPIYKKDSYNIQSFSYTLSVGRK